jgi:hypothetical protein
MHNFYANVLNLILNVSADLVCPALHNVLLVSTGLGTAGLGLGLGTVGLGLDLGLGRPGLYKIPAEVQARRIGLLPRRNMVAVQHNDQRLLQCHEMTRSGQISAADDIP